jgi:hypothetical protein
LAITRTIKEDTGDQVTPHQITNDDTIGQGALAHRLVTLELAEPEITNAAHSQISSALRWRDACDARQLVVNMLVQHAQGLAQVGRIVRHVDAVAAPHRDRPTLRVYCVLAESIERLVGQLAEADTRTPRIEVIRVLNRPLEPQRLAQLMRESTSAESSRLQFWTYLELSSTSELAQLANLMCDQGLDLPHQSAFRRFPIVEVPGAFSISDAKPIAEFWAQHPRLQEAATRSLHGRVDTFFRLFELARLTQVGVELQPISGHGNPNDYQRLPAFCKWADRSGLLTTEPHMTNAVLEHDVDLLTDSHECQSPVFSFAAVSTYVDTLRSSGDVL